MYKINEKINTVICGDSGIELKKFPDCCIDSIVSDPPAGIAFMASDWDKDKGGRDQWIDWMSSIAKECLRVLKPGSHGFIWAIPRTSHWTATAFENAGFEIRDIITHIYGEGFPKNADVSKAIDKMAGAEREVILEGAKGKGQGNTYGKDLNVNFKQREITAPSTDDAKKWDGWGTALKPASENWILIRKPLEEKTIAKNVLRHGTGAININQSRIEGGERKLLENKGEKSVKCYGDGLHGSKSIGTTNQGRWPSNVILDEFSANLLDKQSGESKSSESNYNFENSKQGNVPIANNIKSGIHFNDTGGASRYFKVIENRFLYIAKPSKAEKNALCEFVEAKKTNDGREKDADNAYQRGATQRNNFHPTVKSIKLMKYLINMINPPGGLILDCFLGSGSTAIAARALGFNFIGIEKDPDYVKIAEARLRQGYLF